MQTSSLSLRAALLVKIALALGAAGAIAVLAKALGTFAGHAIQLAVTAAAAIAAYELATRSDRLRPAAIGALVAAAGLGIYWLAPLAASNLSAPHTWDFLAFYVDGSVGSRGLNFYQPENYQRVYQELAVPIVAEEGFEREVVEVGFKYPPMTMFLFAWLGFLTFETAHALWMTFVCAGFALAAWLIARHLLVAGSLPLRALAATALLALLPASASNLVFEQTNWWLLAMTLLVLAAAGPWREALYAAAAITIKPILALAVAWLALRGHWRGVALCALCGLLLLAAAALVFGPATVLDYFRANPIAHVPPWQFTEWINQSLLATLLRSRDETLPGSAMLYTPFLLIGGAVAAISAWFAWRLARAEDDLALGLLVSAALLLYPGTLWPYSVLGMLPLLQLHARLPNAAWAPAAAAAFTAVVYALNAKVSFAANALLWSGCCLAAATRPRSLSD